MFWPVKGDFRSRTWLDGCFWPLPDWAQSAVLRQVVELRSSGASWVPEIAAALVMSSGKNAGKHPSVASVYRALAEYDAAQADAQLVDTEVLVPGRVRPLEPVAG